MPKHFGDDGRDAADDVCVEYYGRYDDNGTRVPLYVRQQGQYLRCVQHDDAAGKSGGAVHVR